VFGAGEGVAAHLGRVLRDAGHHLGLELGVALGEARGHPVVDPEQVVEDEDLAVGGRPGADSDHGDVEALHELVGHGRRDGLEDDGEASRLLERDRVVSDRERPLRRPALGPITTECGRRLRREADVPHDGNARVDDGASALGARTPALELDGVAARLLDEALGGGDRLLVRPLVGAEGQVADEQG
jgi:hypothetical protein